MAHLSIRHQSRMVILQSLYEWDFDHEQNIEEILKRNIKSSGFKTDEEFCLKIAKGVVKNIEKINKTIQKTAPDWPLEQIASIDRSILRLAIFELIFDEEVPPKAAINEAVELGKEFGGENSGKFVNGVLGTIYRESSRYVEEEDITLSGSIVYLKEDDEVSFLLIKEDGKWTLPKTEVNEGETWQEAAARAVKIKTGLAEAEIVEDFGEIKNIEKKGSVTINKKTYLFLIKTGKKDIKQGQWLKSDEVIKSIKDEKLKGVFEKALEKINS
jgi:transcription antitermination protein NusB